ncbi:MAG TPA: CDP-glucose 4,6-dehydratase [Ideonella sp.]|nr:CDP-glucose 4,6-dehydratase [Ideonella sp.]
MEAMGLSPQFWRGKRVLVTGHTGFKGSWLALWLHELGAEVHGLALPAEHQPHHAALLGLPARLASEHLVDIRDAQALQQAVRAVQPEFVFHLAAQALVRRSYREPTQTFATNVMGLVHLLEALRAWPGARAVVNATTDKCYANDGAALAFRETDPLGGHDPYSASKACAEIVSASYRDSYFAARAQGTPAPALATARAGNVIGGGDWSEDRLIPDLVRAAQAGRLAPIRNPQAIRPWQHVLEPLCGYLLLGQQLWHEGPASAQAWNFGPSIEDHLPVGAVIAGFTHHWPALRHQADPGPHPHEAATLHLDCSKAQQQLQWRPVWRTGMALERTVQWYRDWHQAGAVNTLADLHQYAADARRAGFAWAGA